MCHIVWRSAAKLTVVCWASVMPRFSVVNRLGRSQCTESFIGDMSPSPAMVSYPQFLEQRFDHEDAVEVPDRGVDRLDGHTPRHHRYQCYCGEQRR
nr:hypothetical protein CFP56_19197 [Quercus suber]